MHLVTQFVVIYYRDCRIQTGRGAQVAGADSVGSAHISIPLTMQPHLTQRKESGEGGVADLPEVRMAESTGSAPSSQHTSDRFTVSEVTPGAPRLPSREPRPHSDPGFVLHR